MEQQRYSKQDLKNAFHAYYMVGFPHQINFDEWFKKYEPVERNVPRTKSYSEQSPTVKEFIDNLPISNVPQAAKEIYAKHWAKWVNETFENDKEVMPDDCEDEVGINQFQIDAMNEYKNESNVPVEQENEDELWNEVIVNARWHNGTWGKDRQERLVEYFKKQFSITRKIST